MNRKQQVILAIVKNAADDCREAFFANPDEVRVIKVLAKRGILKVRKAETRTAGLPDYFATYA